MIVSVLNSGKLKPIKKLKELDEMFMELEKERHEKIISNTSKLLGMKNSRKWYETSRNMRSSTQHLGLLESIIREDRVLVGFKEKNLAKRVEVKSSSGRYNVEIVSHNDEVGLLGTCVKGVCIPHNGEDRMSQLTSDFMNLIIRTDEKIFLWGLLCRAIDTDGNYFYVLNNLQGGINDKRIVTSSVLEDIYKAFNLFCEDNKVKSILYKEQVFNAVSLSGNKIEKSSSSTYGIALTSVIAERKGLRLDFYIDYGLERFGMIDEVDFMSFNILPKQ